ncbi:MAG: geranylgeranyl reductase family protein [Planctomycetota bacterium]|jgi:geranylgeranyl reductase family protein
MQLTPDSLPDGTWDTIIVGAGPAGAVCAAHLAERGRRVLAVDRARFPREKVCGDCLSPDALRCLERLGILGEARAAGHTVRGVDVYSPSRIHLPLRGEFVSIRRRDLDAIVAARAERSGAVLGLGTVEALATGADGSVECSVAGRPSPLRARVGVIATGVELGLLEKLGMSGRPRPSGVAVRCYVRSRSGPQRLVVAYERGLVPGYGWIFPMGGGEYNVGVSAFLRDEYGGRANLRREFEAFTHSHPAARRMMDGAEGVTPLQGGILRCAMEGARPGGDGNVIAIGETIGTALPYTGEGIGKAMETGELAAEVIDDALGSGGISRLRRYAERIDSELRPRYAGYLRLESWIARPWLNNLLTLATRHNGEGRAAAAGVLSEADDPADFFTVKGVLRVLRGWGHKVGRVG